MANYLNHLVIYSTSKQATSLNIMFSNETAELTATTEEVANDTIRDENTLSFVFNDILKVTPYKPLELELTPVDAHKTVYPKDETIYVTVPLDDLYYDLEESASKEASLEITNAGIKTIYNFLKNIYYHYAVNVMIKNK